MGLSLPAIQKPKWQYHLVGQLNTVNVQNAHKWTDRPWRSWSLQVWSPPARWLTASRRTTILSTLVRWSSSPFETKSEHIFPGKFEDLTHSVKGDIFVLDEKTIYIQVGIGLKNTEHKKKHKIEWFTITWHCCYETHWNPLALLHIRLNQCNKENKPM